jgi:hypothetical protein
MRPGDPARLISDEIEMRASEVLSRRFGTGTYVVGYDVLSSEGHAFVVRLQLAGGPVSSAVLKLARRDETGRFRVDDADPYSPSQRLWNEWAGLEFLRGLPEPCTTVPDFYGGDAELGFVLMEDLGDGPSLADILLAGSAVSATNALTGYVDALADIHLATFGRAADYHAIRTRLGKLTTDPGLLSATTAARTIIPIFRRLVPNLSLSMAGTRALRWIDEIVSEPGPWEAFSLNDCCPDNNRVYSDRPIRLFDIEFASMRHALLDLAYVRTVMPTCWCVRRLPKGFGDKLVARYRDRLVSAGHDFGSDKEFEAALNACAALWALIGLRWHSGPALESEGDYRPYMDRYNFHLGSRRQIVMQRLDELSAVAQRQKELAALHSELAEPVRQAAQRAWRKVELLPLYPAFS